MATQVSLAIRRAEAMDGILAASRTLQERYGMRNTLSDVTHRDPDIERVLLLEEVSRFLVELAAVGFDTAQTPTQPAKAKRGKA